MANVRVDVDYTLKDGQSIIFKAPCDCGSVSGLIIYYPELIDNEITTLSKVFSFRDSHNNDLSEINELFATGAYVHVILDTVNAYAYLQNADTNAYLEEKFKSGDTIIVPYNESKVATAGQTIFSIDSTTVDTSRDIVEVYSGRTRLSPNGDYTVSNNSITLTEGVPAGRTVDIRILQNAKIFAEDYIVPISQGGTGAKTAGEALAYLGGLSNYLGSVSNANLLTWFVEQAQIGGNGCFIVDPTITKEGLPLTGWYSGIFSAGGGFAFIFALETGKIFVNMTVSGVWQDWKELFTTEGGMLIGELNTTNGINIERTQNGEIVRQRFYPLGDYVGSRKAIGMEHIVDGVAIAKFMFNDNGVVLADMVNSKKYNIFGEHNSNRTQLVSAETTPTTNNEIFWTYK